MQDVSDFDDLAEFELAEPNGNNEPTNDFDESIDPDLLVDDIPPKQGVKRAIEIDVESSDPNSIPTYEDSIETNLKKPKTLTSEEDTQLQELDELLNDAPQDSLDEPQSVPQSSNEQQKREKLHQAGSISQAQDLPVQDYLSQQREPQHAEHPSDLEPTTQNEAIHSTEQYPEEPNERNGLDEDALVDEGEEVSIVTGTQLGSEEKEEVSQEGAEENDSNFDGVTTQSSLVSSGAMDVELSLHGDDEELSTAQRVPPTSAGGTSVASTTTALATSINNNTVETESTALTWANMSAELLALILSHSQILALSDVAACLRVCKSWQSSETHVWRSLCFKEWRLGGSWRQECNFFSNENYLKTIHFKDLFKWRCLLAGKRNLMKRHIEEAYSIIENLLLSRDRNPSNVSNPTYYDQIQQIMAATERCVRFEKRAQQFERDINQDYCLVKESERNDLFYLINNMFIEVNPLLEEQTNNNNNNNSSNRYPVVQPTTCTMITKSGSIARVSIDGAGSVSYSLPASFAIRFSCENRQGLLFEYQVHSSNNNNNNNNDSSSCELHLEELSYLKERIGLTQLTDCRFFFFLWCYCLSSYDIQSTHSNDIGHYLLTQHGWKWSNCLLFTSSTSQEEEDEFQNDAQTTERDIHKNYNDNNDNSNNNDDNDNPITEDINKFLSTVGETSAGGATNVDAIDEDVIDIEEHASDDD